MRHLLSLIIVLAIFTLPYWVYLPIIIFGIVAIPFYFEAIAFGLLIDVYYGVPAGFFMFPFGMGLTLLVLLALPFRTYIRFHA